MVKGLAAAVSALWLSACAVPPGGPDGDAVNVGPQGRACYRTLARVDCHARPLPDEAARRVGFFDWAALGHRAGY